MGNGCVALPTTIEGAPVRVMDDLATDERSRWEVWAELNHRRFDVLAFIGILNEEFSKKVGDIAHAVTLRKISTDEGPERQKWLYVGQQLLLKLVTDRKPVLNVTELMMSFLYDEVRKSPAPWAYMQAIDPDKYCIDFSHLINSHL